MTVSTRRLLENAERPSHDARKLHPRYRGKIEVVPKCRIRDLNDFAIWYTPGVAAVCKDIQADPELAYSYTNKWNTVAVVTDGTRVLGLGDIGPEAGLPVMEGKALIFKYLGGVDAVPVCLGTKDQQKIIDTVKILQPSFGGINLEDIEQPKCFPVLQTLRRECHIPVWHDDQQGTALVTLAGLINALKIVNKKIATARIVLVGAGSANICFARLVMHYGAHPERIIMVDHHGILNCARTSLQATHPEKWEICRVTNGEQREGGIPEALAGADVVIALSAPGPGIIKPAWIRKMAPRAIVFACANPVPEIWPWEASEAGAHVVATGRSDFANQVNNSLGFPGVFRGTLDVRARTITDEMCIAASVELARCLKPAALAPDRILPTMDDWDVSPRIAAAVGMMAQKQKVAGRKAAADTIYREAKALITRSRNLTAMMMKKKFIK